MLERLKAGNIKGLESFLKSAAKAIRDRLASDELTALARSRAEAQLVAIRNDLKAIYGDAGKQITSDLKDLADYATGAESRALDAVLMQGVELAVPSANQVLAAAMSRPLTSGQSAKMLEPFINGWVTGSIDSVENAIRLGYLQGRTNRELINEVVGTASNKYKDGIIDATYRNAQAVVRTSVQHVAQVARSEMWAQNADIITGYEWVSTLDSRTTVQCFPAHTDVESLGELENIFRANYSGEFIIITTASGKKLTGTPNHPVLTSSGFLPLHEINPSKKVIRAVFDERVMVNTDKDVGMPSCIGELFDSFSKLPGLDVQREGASAVDFYGDGRAMNGEVDIIRVDSQLRSDNISSICENVGDELLSSVEPTCGLPTNCGQLLLFVRNRLPEMASEIDVFAIENGIDAAFTSSDNSCDFAWLNAFIEKLDNPESIGLDVYITLSSLKDWHDSMLLKHGCNSGSSGAISSANLGSRNTFSIEPDDVISVTSEFADCHVYTLGTSLGVYIAEDIIVKNCQALDGRVFEIGKGPLPPGHINCRSATSPIIANKYIRDTLRQGATRVSNGETGGPVSANTSYYEWLKTQPAGFQDEALGPMRAQLFRDGGLSAQRFQELQLGKQFEPLTLDQMKELEPVAFERAGL